MKQKITLVIPYHTHPQTIDFVKRQLNYYHQQSVSTVVILAMSGDKNIISELNEYIKTINNPCFRSFSTGEDDITNVSAFASKIYEALKLVETPYAVINGADDLVLLGELEKGIQLLESNPGISAAKGHTIYYNLTSGTTFNSQDLEIQDNCPYNRLKVVMTDRESIFYAIRRTKDLLEDYQKIEYLMEQSNIMANSFYHIEHLVSLSLAARGDLRVFRSPWRIETSHDHNHTSYVPASFIRIKLGPLDKGNYQWFQSVTPNVDRLGYIRYRYLWACHQIRGIHLTLKQIVYNFLHKKCNLRELFRILAYYSLNRIFILLRKILPDSTFVGKQILYGNTKDFVESKYYKDLKKYYFSEKDIQLIESNIN